MVTQVEIARRVGLDVSSVNKILNRRAGPVFKKETIRKVFKVAKDLGYDFNRIKFHHRRRHPRLPVEVEAEICFYKRDGSVYDRGVAVIRDLSLSGAKVGDVKLPLGTIPVEPFTVALRPLVKPLEEVYLPGSVVRLEANGGMNFGICFGKVEGSGLKRLSRFIGN